MSGVISERKIKVSPGEKRIFIGDAVISEIGVGAKVEFYKSLTVTGMICEGVEIIQAIQVIGIKNAEDSKSILKIEGNMGAYVKIYATSASVFIHGWIGKNFRAQAVEGDLEILGDIKDSGFLSSTSGKITVQGCVENSVIRTTAGEIEINVLSRGAKVFSTSGNVFVRELQEGAEIKVTEANVRLGSLWAPQALRQVKIFGSRGKLERP